MDTLDYNKTKIVFKLAELGTIAAFLLMRVRKPIGL